MTVLADVTERDWRVVAETDGTAATVRFTHNGELFKTVRWTLDAVRTLLAPDRLPEILARFERGTSLSDALLHAAQTRRRARCTCGEPGDTCPMHQALIDAYDAEHGDEDDEYLGGSYEPDYHFARELAPRGL